jgi:predicted Zn-dependent protease with MMP-like domain
MSKRADYDDQVWAALFEEADRVVREAIAGMPEELRREAERIPCLLEKWPPDGEDVLGRYLSFEPNFISQAPGPLVLYLGSIRQECEEYELDYAEEVKITYLHELGHHLGLDEGDLEERGLL